ncbi:MAG: MOP flippase family protein [Candidatus Glassbacteria bacterium]
MADSGQSLGRRAISGFAWTGLSQTAVQTIQFGVTIVLARLLFPEDFGLVGMAAVFTEAIGTLSGLALAPAIIHRKKLQEKHLSTSFWAGIGTGALLFIAAIVASKPLSMFYGREIIAPIVILSSIGFIAGPLGGIHRALLTRELAFKRLMMTEVGATVSSASISILLALLGFGPYSLVLGGISGTITSSTLMWFLHPWRPGMVFSRAAFGELFKYSRSVLANGLVTYSWTNIDYLLVGKYLGAHLLGLYTLAYRLITIPLNKLSRVITKVTFPTFSIIQDDNSRLQYAYTRTVRLLSLISFPALALLGTTAHDLILVVFGERWLEAVVAVRVLIFVGMLKSVGTLVGSVVLAKGRPSLELGWNLVLLPLLGLGIYLGLPYGIAGVSVAYLIVYSGFFPVVMRLTNSTIDLSDARYYRSYIPAVVTSALMILSILAYDHFVLMPCKVTSYGRLASCASLGTLGWLFSLEYLFPRDRCELIGVLEQISPSIIRFLFVRVDLKCLFQGLGAFRERPAQEK